MHAAVLFIIYNESTAKSGIVLRKGEENKKKVSSSNIDCSNDSIIINSMRGEQGR